MRPLRHRHTKDADRARRLGELKSLHPSPRGHPDYPKTLAGACPGGGRRQPGRSGRDYEQDKRAPHDSYTARGSGEVPSVHGANHVSDRDPTVLEDVGAEAAAVDERP